MVRQQQICVRANRGKYVMGREGWNTDMADELVKGESGWNSFAEREVKAMVDWLLRIVYEV